MSDSPFSLKTAFTAAVVAIAIDLLLVFPISHGSLIGGLITKWSGGFVIPPLDWLATNVLGVKAGAASMAAVDPTVGTGLASTAVPPAMPTGAESAVTPGATGAESASPLPSAPEDIDSFEETISDDGIKTSFHDAWNGLKEMFSPGAAPGLSYA